MRAIVDTGAVLQALDAGRLGRYVCDFPEPGLMGARNVIAMPHIGASTEESEENCAVMAADQLIDFLEHGNIANSRQLPRAAHGAHARRRRASRSANDNVAGVLGHVLSVLADAQGQRGRHVQPQPRRARLQPDRRRHAPGRCRVRRDRRGGACDSGAGALSARPDGAPAA